MDLGVASSNLVIHPSILKLSVIPTLRLPCFYFLRNVGGRDPDRALASVGGAQDCGSWGRGFKSLRPPTSSPLLRSSKFQRRIASEGLRSASHFFVLRSFNEGELRSASLAKKCSVKLSVANVSESAAEPNIKLCITCIFLKVKKTIVITPVSLQILIAELKSIMLEWANIHPPNFRLN